jgi:uncharacterized protein YecE (DUF72 family)
MAQGRYFRAFRLLEVQQTFYQPPGLATLRRRRARTTGREPS